MFEKFAQDTRRIVGYSMEEARSRGDKRLGTEHLLLGALHEAGAAKVLGVSLDQAREAARRLDSAALKAIGLEVGGLPVAKMPVRGRKPPFSSGARDVMAAMVGYAAKEKSRKITTGNLLVSLMEREEQDPASALLKELNVDRTAVRDRLLSAG
ncbi:Clp protease N-terminal domain-containing protein [Paenarthrobacter ilicis]|uniref:ATP-dependent Clp protease ATP-binding subunit ClpA n=1 Tax=Paenarthrobacter ilicis TaxID=43665 RepID=A0ABX0TDF2_9MICC|nr:Clp protease N-terminal domain-containing protein [Paenarthrobacter ilicis]MBM7792209.1 ATP-dependent Clp protease ATP-binding subunit ClpA [Paenarthrobacter ilicis]NIJ00553.1 ATP-dependent Clp protease ATP-binding subunit ClpA [Paenarthrobacter ilicis]